MLVLWIIEVQAPLWNSCQLSFPRFWKRLMSVSHNHLVMRSWSDAAWDRDGYSITCIMRLQPMHPVMISRKFIELVSRCSWIADWVIDEANDDQTLSSRWNQLLSSVDLDHKRCFGLSDQLWCWSQVWGCVRLHVMNLHYGGNTGWRQSAEDERHFVTALMVSDGSWLANNRTCKVDCWCDYTAIK